MSPTDRPDPSPPPPPSDPDARPRSFAQRMGLLLILLVLPVAVVVLPSLVVTHLFGQRPRPKVTAVSPTPTPDTAGLRRELEGKASSLLPTPAALTADPIRLSVRDPSHVGPRAEKVKAQARAFGGTAVEGVATGGEIHLFVDLPAGAEAAFRVAASANVALEMLATPAPLASGATGAARDQVEVFIRAAADDE